MTMMGPGGMQYAMGIGQPEWMPAIGLGLALLLLWSFVWKGLALWHSAKRRQPWWFIAILLLNTGGILEIIYLFGIAKLRFSTLFSK